MSHNTTFFRARYKGYAYGRYVPGNTYSLRLTIINGKVVVSNMEGDPTPYSNFTDLGQDWELLA